MFNWFKLISIVVLIDFNCCFNWFSIYFQLISTDFIYFQLNFNLLSIDFQLISIYFQLIFNLILIDFQLISIYFQFTFNWFSIYFQFMFNWFQLIFNWFLDVLFSFFPFRWQMHTLALWHLITHVSAWCLIVVFFVLWAQCLNKSICRIEGFLKYRTPKSSKLSQMLPF